MRDVKTDARSEFQTVLTRLKAFGFLLESDPKLPSVCSLITGEPLHSSWWSHPLAHTIFRVNEQLEDHPDILITKIISGKVTFVHREIWPELFAIGNSCQDWQLTNLTDEAKTLLKLVDSEGSVRTDKTPRTISGEMKIGDVVRELERRLLLVATQIHTEAGSHAKLIESWEHWSKRIGFQPPSRSAREAQKNLEDRLRDLNNQFGAKARLPWV